MVILLTRDFAVAVFVSNFFQRFQQPCHCLVDWNKTTTYTIIKRCIDKGATERIDPGFVCHALVSRQDAQEYETDELINKMYDGSADMLVASLLNSKRLSRDEISALKDLVNSLK